MASVTRMMMVMLCALGVFFQVTQGALTIVYMPTSCGVLTSVEPSLQLESATGLTYTNNMDCNITFTATSPNLLLAHVKRFELEPQYSGICNDYVNLHDGGDVSSSTLNNDVMCGNTLTNNSYVTSGQELTVHFVTDSRAVYLGFSIVITAVTPGVCSSDQWRCNSSGYCMDNALRCDNYDQCPDLSDETDCDDATTSDDSILMPVIIGVCLGTLVLILVIVFILYRRHRRNQWRRFTNDRIRDHDDDLADPDPAYPVTHKYFRGIRGHPDTTTKSYDSVSGLGKLGKAGGEKGEEVNT